MPGVPAELRIQHHKCSWMAAANLSSCYPCWRSRWNFSFLALTWSSPQLLQAFSGNLPLDRYLSGLCVCVCVRTPANHLASQRNNLKNFSVELFNSLATIYLAELLFTAYLYVPDLFFKLQSDFCLHPSFKIPKLYQPIFPSVKQGTILPTSMPAGVSRPNAGQSHWS